MTTFKSAEKLKCERCKREVIITRPGEGQLTCCGKAMNTPSKDLTVDNEFVLEWSSRYAANHKSGQEANEEKADLDWMFKEKISSRTSLRKAGLWKREINDTSDSAWLEYVKIMRDLSTTLKVTLRELGKALVAYAELGNNFKHCPYCNGIGKVDGSAGIEPIVTCPVCKGVRYNFIPDGFQPCTECYGSGEFIYGNRNAYNKKPCPDCKGTGWTL